MSKSKRKRKTETSKILLVISDVLAGMVTITSISAVFLFHDAQPLEMLIPAVFGLSATSHGFYYWKAKNENIKKYGYNVQEQEQEQEEGESEYADN